MRLPAIQRLAVRMLLALICSLIAAPHPAVGADVRPAEQKPPDPQLSADQDRHSGSRSSKGTSQNHGLAPASPPWFLERMRLRFYEAGLRMPYSLAMEALALLPDPDELHLGAAFAAQAAGRCAQVDSHLLRLEEDSLAVAARRRAARLRARVPRSLATVSSNRCDYWIPTVTSGPGPRSGHSSGAGVGTLPGFVRGCGSSAT